MLPFVFFTAVRSFFPVFFWFFYGFCSSSFLWFSVPKIPCLRLCPGFLPRFCFFPPLSASVLPFFFPWPFVLGSVIPCLWFFRSPFQSNSPQFSPVFLSLVSFFSGPVVSPVFPPFSPLVTFLSLAFIAREQSVSSNH